MGKPTCSLPNEAKVCSRPPWLPKISPGIVNPPLVKSAPVRWLTRLR